MLAAVQSAMVLSLENRAKLLSTLPVIDNSYVNGEYGINIVVSWFEHFYSGLANSTSLKCYLRAKVRRKFQNSGN